MENNRMTRQERAEARAKRKARTKKALLILLCVFLALILIALVAVVIYAESLLGLINRVDNVTQPSMSQEEYDALLESMKETVPEDYTGETLNAEDVDWGNDGDIIETTDDVINIMLIGQDRREGQGRTRSDVMILCTINIPARTITLTSFMRDMYVQIPGYNPNRMNATYAFGGMPLLDKTLETNFGVQVDGNVEVDFNGFIDLVDLMGGVEIELTKKEADYMNSNVSWDVDDGSSKDWHLKEGVNQLTGSQALSYARMRKVGNADYERTARQRRVLTALVEKAKQLSISELNLLLQHALPMITTDMEDSEIVGYALELFPILSEFEIQSKRIPADGCYKSTTVDGMAVLVPDLEKNRAILREIMDPN